MSNERSSKTGQGGSMAYQIRVKGQLGAEWTEWLGGMAITWDDNGNTLLTGLVADQAALHGLLKKVRDLGMPLLSVNQVKRHRRKRTRK